jgi:hypothetical protein
LLNLIKQTDDAEKGLKYIADLLVQFKLVEKTYSEEINDTEEYSHFLYRISVIFKPSPREMATNLLF